MSLRRAAAFALAALVLYVGCQDAGARVRVHQRRGDAYLEQGELAEAILEYKNVLQFDPNHAEAHWGLARAYLGNKQYNRAYWELQETVRLAPHNFDAALQLGQFLLYGEEDDLIQALEFSDRVLAADPTSDKAWLLRARALQSLERFAEAEVAFEKAVETAPDNPRMLLRQANFLASRGMRDKAEPLFLRLTELQPGFAANVALAGFYASEPGREAEAEAAYRDALATAEAEYRVDAYTVLSNFYYLQGRYDESEATLLEGLATEQDNLELIYALARFYHARGEVEKADAMIEESTRASGGDPGPYLVLSAYRGRQGDLDGALAAARSAVEVAPTDRRARLREAEVLVDIGFRRENPERIAEGRSVVDAVLATEPSNPEALFVKAKIDIANDSFDEAASGLRRALESRPDWAQAHFLLGSVLFLRDDAPGARAEAVRALELDANLLEAKRLLVQINSRLGEDDLVIEIGRRVLEITPDDAGVRVLMAQSLVHLSRVDEALEQLGAIPESERDAESYYARGRLQYLQGQLDAARTSLLAADELQPHTYDILRALMDIDLVQDSIRQSIDRIRAAVREKPKDSRLAQLNGELSFALGRMVEAGRSFERAIELDPNDIRAYQQFANYLLVSGQPDQVVQTYEKALQANPDSGALHLILGSLYETQLRFPEAMERYEEALRLDPTLAVAKNNLAYLLAETSGNLDRALDLAQEAKELLPDDPSTADTLGWVLYKKRIPSAAIGYLQEAERGMPIDNPQIGVVRHHLALAYEANDQPDRARDVLARALRDLESLGAREDPPWAGEVRAMLQRLGANGQTGSGTDKVAVSQDG